MAGTMFVKKKLGPIMLSVFSKSYLNIFICDFRVYNMMGTEHHTA